MVYYNQDNTCDNTSGINKTSATAREIRTKSCEGCGPPWGHWTSHANCAATIIKNRRLKQPSNQMPRSSITIHELLPKKTAKAYQALRTNPVKTNIFSLSRIRREVKEFLIATNMTSCNTSHVDLRLTEVHVW